MEGTETETETEKVLATSSLGVLAAVLLAASTLILRSFDEYGFIPRGYTTRINPYVGRCQ
jgi:hypothetical protein